MPKIFLIKNRLHQQQLRLLESQNLLNAKDEDRLGPLNSPVSPHSHNQRCITRTDEPLSLVSRKKDNKESGTVYLQHKKYTAISLNLLSIFYINKVLV